MNIYMLLLILALISTVSFVVARRKSMAAVEGEIKLLHSLPGHYGWFTALTGIIPGLFIIFVWAVFGSTLIENLTIAQLGDQVNSMTKFELSILLNDIKNLSVGDAISRPVTDELRASSQYYSQLVSSVFWIASLSAVGVTAICSYFAIKQVEPEQRSRNYIEQVVMTGLIACSVIAILTTIGIVSSLLFETARFVEKVPLTEFLFGLQWSPQTALRADQVGSSGSFGAIPLFAGTLLITAIALIVAAPVGLLSAVYMTEFADKKTRSIFKPLLEVLAGIPTVVYGFFAALIVAPFFRDAGAVLGLSIASESALAAGVVMGIMIIPLMSSLSDDVIAAVPQSLRDGSYGLGATKTETILNVILPAALPGIVSAFLLAASRAIGETMIVVMAAGMAAKITANPFEAVTTVTVQIVTLLTGDQEFDSAKTLSAFALGLTLFVVTLGLNFVALHVVRKYREQYD